MMSRRTPVMVPFVVWCAVALRGAWDLRRSPARSCVVRRGSSRAWDDPQSFASSLSLHFGSLCRRRYSCTRLRRCSCTCLQDSQKKPPPCARCAPSPALFRCSMFVLAVPRPVAPRTGWLWHWDCVCDAMQTGLERCRPRRDATTGTEASCASRRISLGWLVLCEPAERLPWRDGDPRLWRRCAAPGRAETSAAV